MAECKPNNMRGLCSCVFIEDMNPEMKSLIYWREPLKSAVAFISGLTILFSLANLSFISVVSYLCLTILCCTAGWRLYHDFSSSFKKTDQTCANKTHPFQAWLQCDVELPKREIQRFMNWMASIFTDQLEYLKHVLVAESYLDSAKFAVCMYLLTFLGGWFNVLTIVTLAYITLFTWPRFYEMYQPQIDRIFEIILYYLSFLWAQVKQRLDALPIVGKTKSQ